MIQKSFLSLSSLLDPIAEKKNCLFLIKVLDPPNNNFCIRSRVVGCVVS